MHPDTRSQLLTEAEAVVRRIGYAGFSYADVAGRVGIRKPSIHHHFPAKEDLGAALVEAYTDRFKESLADIAAASLRAPERLRAYAGLYRAGLEAGRGWRPGRAVSAVCWPPNCPACRSAYVRGCAGSSS